ncbi:transporter, NhaC family [Caloramator quimbayensis]|uniref:Transporter, NhaC family n=1 Tax=Caloramator quimbayensis TaxID=1147123 RepID=A0A1T4YGM3_9CLOT|nr:Na+/H+ antiporter NhaC family protein [Caloramator quimbayensis]SKB00385.1 transporter, NhaC family [Caloramator quimbayensis]
MKNTINKTDVTLILTSIFVIIGGCVLSNISLSYGFLLCIFLSFILFIKKGFSFKELFHMITKGLGECKILYLLILLIGATVSIWMSSGIVPSMIYYGFEYLRGVNFLFAAFLIMSISAVFMGTAIGTLSTIGIAVLGIGTGFSIPSNILLGVIVSGAFIADKISPISGLLNLTLSTTNTRYSKALKSMAATLIPAFIITSFLYYLLGIKYSGNIDIFRIREFQHSIKDVFFISPYLLLIPFAIVIMSLFGIKIIYSLLMGLFCGIIISFNLQKFTFIQILKYIIWGYRGNTPSAKLNGILISGGMVSMIEVLLIVMGAIALSSILEGTKVIHFLTDKVISNIKNERELILKTGIISCILTIVTCDQTMGIVLPARDFALENF